MEIDTFSQTAVSGHFRRVGCLPWTKNVRSSTMSRPKTKARALALPCSGIVHRSWQHNLCWIILRLWIDKWRKPSSIQFVQFLDLRPCRGRPDYHDCRCCVSKEGACSCWVSLAVYMPFLESLIRLRVILASFRDVKNTCYTAVWASDWESSMVKLPTCPTPLHPPWWKWLEQLRELQLLRKHPMVLKLIALVLAVVLPPTTATSPRAGRTGILHECALRWELYGAARCQLPAAF